MEKQGLPKNTLAWSSQAQAGGFEVSTRKESQEWMIWMPHELGQTSKFLFAVFLNYGYALSTTRSKAHMNVGQNCFSDTATECQCMFCYTCAQQHVKLYMSTYRQLDSVSVETTSSVVVLLPLLPLLLPDAVVTAEPVV